eukprot:g41523.t1
MRQWSLRKLAVGFIAPCGINVDYSSLQTSIGGRSTCRPTRTLILGGANLLDARDLENYNLLPESETMAISSAARNAVAIQNFCDELVDLEITAVLTFILV